MKKLALMLTAVILVICTVAWLASFIAPKSSRTAEQFPAERGAAEYPPAAPSEVPGGGAATRGESTATERWKPGRSSGRTGNSITGVLPSRRCVQLRSTP